MAFFEQVVIRGLHVLAGTFWVGAAIVMAGFLAPTSRRVGQSGAAFMRELNTRSRLPLATNIAALLTIVTGFWLLWRMSGGLNPYWFASSYGATLTVGMVAALAAYAISVGIQRPAMQTIARAQGQGGTPDDSAREALARAQARITMGGRAGAVLLAVSVICMAVARYV